VGRNNILGGDVISMYEIRARRKVAEAERARRTATCGLGGGNCCSSCASGGQCETTVHLEPQDNGWPEPGDGAPGDGDRQPSAAPAPPVMTRQSGTQPPAPRPRQPHTDVPTSTLGIDTGLGPAKVTRSVSVPPFVQAMTNAGLGPRVEETVNRGTNVPPSVQAHVNAGLPLTTNTPPGSQAIRSALPPPLSQLGIKSWLQAGAGDLPTLQTALSGLQGGATGDAAAAFYASIQAGNTYLTSVQPGDTTLYDSAVDAYKAAGQAAVSSTGAGGELASADPTNTVVTYTNQAYSVNAQLNSKTINSTNSTGTAATQDDATRAQGFVQQMLNFYMAGAQAAIAANQLTPTPPPSPAPAPPAPTPTPVTPVSPSPAPAGAASHSSYTTPILVGASLLGATIVGYALYRRYYKPGPTSRAKTRKSGHSTHSARTVRP
jgi:hypothetical protein